MVTSLGRALIVVDVQPDFMRGGALAVRDAEAILEPVARLMRDPGYALVVATQDWHPARHVSFASAHPGRAVFETIELYGHPQMLWPDHCVQGTAGAALAPGLPWERAAVVIRKGTDARVDSYSAFRNNWDAAGERSPTGLAGYLAERGVRAVDVCGLARDYCCLWTAEDAAEAGFRARLCWEATRPVDPASDARVRAALERRGVTIL
jgi:nicotinamidase/pyrazinamidase